MVTPPLPLATYDISYHSTPMTLSTADKNNIYSLFLTNMKALYLKSRGGLSEPDKVAELFCVTESRYLIVRDSATQKIVAFTHFRFTDDFDEVDSSGSESEGDEAIKRIRPQECAYVYEIQVSPGVRCGLGRRMMDLVELCALHEGMPKVSLTVFHSNLAAVRFYAKLGYMVDSAIDPNSNR